MQSTVTVGSSRRVMRDQNVHAHGWILIKTLIISFGILSGLFLLSQGYVNADGGEAATTTESETITIATTGNNEVAVVPDSYQYVVEPDDNMSKIVRRSVTLYDQGNDSIELTEAQVIYIETNIVQEMDPRLLDINEDFEVTRSLIEKYVALAPGLSEATLAAWDGYAKNATFELAEITPTNVPLNDDGSLDTDYTPPPVVQDTPEQTTDTSSTPAYWWIIGLLAIVAVVFVLMPSQNKK